MTPNVALWRVFLVAALLTTAGCGVAPTRVHVISIYEPAQQPVEVVVGDSRGPVVLALSSSEPTTWAITLERNVVLKEIILQGGPKGPSRVVGAPPDVPIWSEVFGSASEVGDYGYRLAVHYLKERYGQEPASFNIENSGREFGVGTAPRAPPPVEHAEEVTYRLVVLFGSACCGIDRGAFDRLSTIIAAHERRLGRPLEQKHVRWGIEGEINICLPLTELTPTEQELFVKQVQSEVTVRARVHENIPCRGGWIP